MRFCKHHENKVYTPRTIKTANTNCKHCGVYQDVADKKIRIYCFGTNNECPKKFSTR